mmetsp:Transcript_31238/g.51027  ORF Transcript_31238/g.51027 Transcript_31238/m.51027 type:complete len:81 (+) Transcript_31238:407-649(+)
MNVLWLYPSGFVVDGAGEEFLGPLLLLELFEDNVGFGVDGDILREDVYDAILRKDVSRSLPLLELFEDLPVLIDLPVLEE